MAGHSVATGRNDLVLANAAAEAGLPAQGIDSPPLALPISGYEIRLPGFELTYDKDHPLRNREIMRA